MNLITIDEDEDTNKLSYDDPIDEDMSPLNGKYIFFNNAYAKFLFLFFYLRGDLLNHQIDIYLMFGKII